ncbi:MAG: hypothetical protein KC417_00080, partial [Myxococcales bacterium]|nr:hypothetical protein [Myxococcales bacterium]
MGAIGAVIVLCFVWACDDASSKDAGTQSDASSDGAFDAPEPVELPDDSVPLADLSSGVLMATCDDIVSAVGFTHEELIVVTCLGQLFLSTAEDAPEPPTTKPMCESALATCVADSPVTAELAAVARSIDCKTVTASLGNYGGGASTGELRACLRE